MIGAGATGRLRLGAGVELALLVATTLPACAPGTYVVLEVGADLRIPDETDSLEVTVVGGLDAAELLHTLLPLDAELQFPIEVSLEPQSATPRQLQVNVNAALQGVPAADGSTTFGWQPDTVLRMQVPLRRL